MDPGYVSDGAPAGSNGGRHLENTAGWRHNIHSDDDDNDNKHLQPQPMRASLSAGDAGSLSLHASQRLQSTPRGKAAAGRQGALHRVYRTARPVTASSSATEPSEAGTLGNSSVSLSSAEDADQEDHHNNRNKRADNDNSEAGAAREYWNRVILDIEDIAAGDLPQMAPSSSRQQYLAAQAPSTGSSTLVEHEAGIHKDVLPSTLGRRHSPSPPGQHSSRFAAAVTYAELEQEQRDRSLSISTSAAERSTTPQQQYHRSDAYSTVQEGESQVASRVHDIFQRHIHNASTSYASRRSSVNTAIRDTSRTKQPRQRLRDLLAASEADSNHAGSQSRRRRSSDTPQSNGVENQADQASISGGSRHAMSHTQPASLFSRSRSQGDDTRTQDGRRDQTFEDSTPPLMRSGEGGLNEDQEPQRNLSSSSHKRTSRKQGPLEQAAELRTFQRMTADIPQHYDTEDQESVNDGDIEDHRSEVGENTNHRATSGHTSDETSQWRDWKRQSLYESEADEVDDDTLPSLPGLPSDEEDAEQLLYPSHLDALSRRPARASPPIKPQQGSANIAGSSPRRPATPTVVPLHASPSPRRTLRQSHNLFQASTNVKTPPKTPRFPGHYLSTTPFSTKSTDNPSMLTSPFARDTTALDQSQSRIFGNASLTVPGLPGGYTSPSTHSRAPRNIAVPEPPLVTRQETAPMEDRRKRDRFSSMLHRVIEDADHEERPPPEAYEGSNEASQNLSQYRQGSGQTGASPAKVVAARASYADEKLEQQIQNVSASTSSLATAENTLQALLVDLVRPLKGLLGGFPNAEVATTPNSPKQANQEDSEATMVSNQSFEQRSMDRRKRRSEQDAILRQLQQADLLDHDLVSQAEEVKFALQDMGNKFTTQVTCVLNETFARENRRRKLWFLFLILAELSLVWALFNFANARANLLYQTTYYDPFSPELYTPPPPPHIASLYQSTSAGDVNTQHSQYKSVALLDIISSYFRISSNPLQSFLLTSANIPDYDTSIISRQDTIAHAGPIKYVQHFIGIIRNLYHRLLSIGLGPPSFAHGTLGGESGNSEVPWLSLSTKSQLYRVPT